MVSSIIFLGSQMTVAGAQRVLFNQARWFHKKGYKVTTAFFYDKDGLKEQWNAAYPFPVIDLGARKMGASPLTNLFYLISGSFRLWNLLRVHRFEVIETFTPDSNLLGLLVARLAGVPIRIASHHGYIEGAGELRKRVHGWLVNLGFAQCLVAVSERVRRMAIQEEGVRAAKVKVILNGIEPVRPSKPGSVSQPQLREQLGIKPDDFVYLTVGRLTVQKGHTYLLDAIPRVLARYPERTVFLVAGGGHQFEDLVAKSARLKLEKSIKFLGIRQDVPDLLSIANVFVLPSLWEGLPLALLEAMSLGLPVVATRVEGVENVITDEENGYLVPPKDVEALGAALVRIREDHNARGAFGQRNADLVLQEFTVEAMCQEYEDLFLSVYHQECEG